VSKQVIFCCLIEAFNLTAPLRIARLAEDEIRAEFGDDHRGVVSFEGGPIIEIQR